MTDASDSIIAARLYVREQLAGRQADPSALLSLTEDLSPYVTGDAVNTEAVDRWIAANSTAPAPTHGRVPSQGQRSVDHTDRSVGAVGREEARKRFGTTATDQNNELLDKMGVKRPATRNGQ